MAQPVGKITVRCEACGFTLRDYPVKANTLPVICPKCHTKDSWKEIRPRLWLPLHSARR